MKRLIPWLTLAALACCQYASAEATGLKKIKDIIIYQDPMYYSTFPSAVVRKDGEVIVAFRRAPDRKALWGGGGYTHTDTNSYLVLVRSKDNGETWTKEPEIFFAHPLGGSQDPCMVQLRDGSIVCTSYGWALVPEQAFEKLKGANHHGAYHFLGGYVLRSDDGAKTWKGPFVPIQIPGNTAIDALGKPVAAFNRGAMCQGKDGRLYWAIAGRDGGSGPTQVHLMISSDRGETWTYSCPIAKDDKITFNETSVIETKKGDLVAFMRTANFDDHLAVARSTDGGKSFGKWQDGGVIGHPYYAMHLKDGRILLVYGYRHEPFGIRARIVDAECTNIATAPETVLRTDGGGVDIGYTWAVQLKDGRVLVVYYLNIKDGTRHIAGTLLELE